MGLPNHSKPKRAVCAALLAVGVAGASLAAPTKHEENLYIPSWEVGNRMFFTKTAHKGVSSARVEDTRGTGGLNKPPKGYIALFNGKDLTHWQGLIEIKKRAAMTPAQRKAEQAKADEFARAHWSAQNGILVFDGKGQSLQTAKDYGDFELYVDWKLRSQGDSGIYLRGNPQVQIWAADASSAQANGKFIGSGGLYNNQKSPSRPTFAADKPVGEWNTFWIRMMGDKVTVKLNDQIVVDNVPLENYWDRGVPLPTVGPIELQNHGNVLEFRNIYVRELKR